jgi:hypothetical protein
MDLVKRSRSLQRKVLITAIVGAATFAATTAADQDPAWSWLLSVFVSGVTLVVQFLIELDGRVDAVRAEVVAVADAGRLLDRSGAGLLGRDAVLDLARHAANLGAGTPESARQLARAEVHRVSEFLADLGSGRQVVYDGDDWYWCMSLVAHARSTIDATTYFSARDGQPVSDDDMWFSELGQRYLDLQAAAVRRGVAVRRIFVVGDSGHLDHPQVLRLVAQQRQLAIAVRRLDASTLASASGTNLPMVIFDGEILYEQTPTRFPAAPGYTKTTLVLDASHVNAMAERFDQLWEAAQE